MSVRAIAIRHGSRPAVVPVPARARRRPLRRRPAGHRLLRSATWASFGDDRRLIGVKLMLIALVFLAVMALEVPW